MNTEWLTIKRIFQTALELTGEKREEYLSEQCKNNPELLHTVLSMLKSSEAFDDFLEENNNKLPVIEAAFHEDLLIGKIIGRYKLIRKIGEGGMGIVYLAERADKAYNALAAFKIITFSLNRDVLARRFLLERQTLANLNHPYIARLLDGGNTAEGLPYLVMEYVEGTPIDEYCEKNGLDITARINLFLKVCEAVNYAHQNLIIHRDLKPDNILITKEERPVVLDFGIAKILNSDKLDLVQTVTLNPARMLTPNYASPEQIKGEPSTTLTDVYSLGMILYKLLTGTLPFDFSNLSFARIEETICSEEPEKPSTKVIESISNKNIKDIKTRKNDFLKGDLDLIILKALRKEPERRYASVEQFVEDLNRYLNGYPVIAQPITFKYKAGKFVQRHKAGVLSAFVILLLLLLGVGGIFWQASIASNQRDKAIKEAGKSEQVIQFLESMLSSPDPYESGKDVTVLELLENSSKEIDEKFSSQPEIEIKLRHTLGNTYLELGNYNLALSQYQREFELCKKLFGEKNAQTANALEHIALTYHYLGSFAKAKPKYEQALKTLQTLPEVEPEILGEAFNDYATFLTDEANYKKAEKFFRESLNLILNNKGENTQEAFAAINNLAIVLRRQNKLDEAAKLYKRALNILDKITDKLSPAKAIILGNIGKIYLEKENYPDAEKYYRQSLDSSLTLYGKDNPMLFNPTLNLGVVYYKIGDYAKAEELIRRSIKVLNAENSDTNPSQAIAEISLARVLYAVNKNDEANRLFKHAFEIREKVFGKNHKLTALAGKEYGKFLIDQNRFRQAEEYIIPAFNVFSEDSSLQDQLKEYGTLLLTLFKNTQDSILIRKYSLISNKLE